MSKNGQHVLPRGDKWNVRRVGAARASKAFDTQDEAIAWARRLAKDLKSEVYIHDRGGRIRERNSYGNDPFPPKG